MTQFRPERLRGLLQAEISDIIRNELKDPRIGFASITSVEVSNDLRHVKAFVSVLGSDSEREDTLAALTKAAGFIRTEVGRRISLRHTPEIIFRPDDSIEHGTHINALLRKLEQEERQKPNG